TRAFRKTCSGSAGIQTHAPEETGALIQRLFLSRFATSHRLDIRHRKDLLHTGVCSPTPGGPSLIKHT
ncbi:hypothetical protein M9458_025348, partial [Cirrhinus mrigala]